MGFDDDIAILAAAPVFGFLDEAALRLLTFAGERHTLSPGEILFRRDDRADAGYVVMSGEIALAARNPDGARILAGPSALIGRNALFAVGRRPSEAAAVTASELMRISAQLMGRVLKEFPDAASAIHRWLADDLLDLTYELGVVRETLAGHAERGPGRGS